MTAASLCAACGLPGHRYGRNEGIERFCPQACINQLRGILEEGRKVWWCEEHVSTGPGNGDGAGEICWFIMFADLAKRHYGWDTKHGPCRMVAATLIVEDTDSGKATA